MLHEDINEFKFENTLTLTESQYVAIWALLPTRRLSGVIRVVALTVVGIVFLFTTYTLVLGVILLGVIVMSVLLPGKILPAGVRSAALDGKKNPVQTVPTWNRIIRWLKMDTLWQRLV